MDGINWSWISSLKKKRTCADDFLCIFDLWEEWERKFLLRLSNIHYSCISSQDHMFTALFLFENTKCFVVGYGNCFNNETGLLKKEYQQTCLVSE